MWRHVAGTAVAQCLRCCATNRKVAGSIPDGVIGIFHWHNPADRTMAMGSTQPLTEMSTRRISWGKRGRCVRLTTLPPPCAVVTIFGNLNTLRTGDANLRFYITTVQDGWRKSAFLTRACFPCTIHLTFRHRASCILGRAFHYSPENAFYIFNQQICFIIWYLLDRASLI